MFKVNRPTLIVLSGMIWLAVGCWLSLLGVNFLISTLLRENQHLSRPLIDPLAPYVGGMESAAYILIVLGLIVGYLKGQYVLGKTVKREVNRIASLVEPTCLSQLYTKKYLILLAVMGFLGMVVRFSPLDLRGVVDVAVGTALICGAFRYFFHAFYMVRKATTYDTLSPS